MGQIEQDRDQDHRQHVSARSKTRRGEGGLQRRHNCWKLWHRMPLCSGVTIVNSVSIDGESQWSFSYQANGAAFTHTLGVNWSYDDVSDLFPMLSGFRSRFVSPR
jgi:hypothetical protein